MASIVGRARGESPVLVVSALGHTTDGLVEALEAAESGNEKRALARVDRLRRETEHVSREFFGPGADGALADAEPLFAELDRMVRAVAVLRSVPPAGRDHFLAHGEMVSAALVGRVLRARGIPARPVDSREIVVTDDRFGRAQPDAAETGERARGVLGPIVARGEVPVTAGFIGSTRDGATTTLGRGGSDYSAAIVGACLGASEIQIWTDVDGMLTADPRIVADPYVVPHLSFAEASELAYFGAKVLHPATIQPAVARNIPVRILNSHRPHARGTLITGERPPSTRPLTAIASKKHVSVISITSTRMLMAHGFLRRLFEVFEKWKTAVDVITTSEVTVSVTVDDRRRLPSIVEALSEFADVESEHDMAIVCVVGEGLQNDPRLIGDVLKNVGDDVPIELVSQAASRRNVTFVIREADLPRVLNQLHGRFFAPEPAPAGLV
jgi:aspartate kinase